MNKKLLICGALVTGLLLTACVKKEAPTEEQTEQQVETTENVTSEAQPAEFTTLEATDEPQIEVAEVAPAQEAPIAAAPAETEAAPAAKPAEPAKAQETPTHYTAPAKTNSGSAQSEDDAVADAIAAAMPALEN